jgi:hypothetical protein
MAVRKLEERLTIALRLNPDDSTQSYRADMEERHATAKLFHKRH